MGKGIAIGVVLGLLIGAVLAAIAIPAMRPTSRDECLLKNLSEAQGDRAASLVAATCARMFPQETSPENRFNQYR